MDAMRGRSRRAAVGVGTAVVLAGAGMTATTASAAGNTPVPVVQVVVGGGHTKVATHDISAGWTTFQVTSQAVNHPAASAQLISLRPGVTLDQLQTDLEGTPGGDSSAFTEVLSSEAVLYGGVQVTGGETGQFSDDLAPGSYYMLNTVYATSKITSDAVPLTVHGPAVAHRAPPSTGTVLMRDMRFRPTTSKLPATGTFTLTNSAKDDADDIHFDVMLPVQPGTTDKEIQAYFDEILAGTAPKGPPAFLASGPQASSGILSPGQSQLFSYDLPAGTYVMLCFITDADTGLPHAFMGMHKVVTLS